ncbi:MULTISPECIES: hypothetical protein [Rheinheimera]|uniref:hypothetical protein n=1 Tax=Rheinheimera TaxID=67575 RepID=UPI00104D879F|nr:hypothetical protein [Rheinheimera sp. D18]QBL10598.1 hypothetical protein E0Z06_14255 [Rheinheimera sp. D18]
MKLVMLLITFMLFPSIVIAKTDYLSTQDYHQAKADYQLQGEFPELIVFNTEKDIILRCDAKQHEANGCFNKALELSQKSGASLALYTLDAPFCSTCLNWNSQIQTLLKQATNMAVSIYYVGD